VLLPVVGVKLACLQAISISLGAGRYLGVITTWRVDTQSKCPLCGRKTRNRELGVLAKHLRAIDTIIDQGL
jgi:hypothetical protein